MRLPLWGVGDMLEGPFSNIYYVYISWRSFGYLRGVLL